MKEYIAKRSRTSVGSNDIIAIAALAKADKEKGNSIINASIGTFLTEEKTLGGSLVIQEALKDHVTEKLGYPSVYGSPDYEKGVMNFLFGDKEEAIRQQNHVFFGATLGGTGACSIAFNLFVDEGKDVLLPDIMWSNYTLIAAKAGIQDKTYHLYNEQGGFNLADLKAKIEAELKTNGRTLVVINDPCENPTGYCLTRKEYDALFDMLNEESRHGYLAVLFDIAYASFYDVKDEPFALFDKLLEKNEFLPLLAFSCSKVYGLYGLRLGALIALCPDESNRQELSLAFGAQARGVYSVPVGAALEAVAKALNDPSKRDELTREIAANKDALARRSVAVLKDLDAAKIPYYPYKSGFFISLKVNDAFALYERMKAKHMYIVPMDSKTVRLALSGMTMEEGHQLVAALKEEIQHD
jgi:aromatic-amino-acid transaminase